MQHLWKVKQPQYCMLPDLHSRGKKITQQMNFPSLNDFLMSSIRHCDKSGHIKQVNEDLWVSLPFLQQIKHPYKTFTCDRSFLFQPMIRSKLTLRLYLILGITHSFSSCCLLGDIQLIYQYYFIAGCSYRWKKSIFCSLEACYDA